MRFFVITLFLILLPLRLFAAEPTYLTQMLIEPAASETRITFHLTKKTFGRVKTVPKAKQVIIEFENTYRRFTLQKARLGGSNVTMINTKQIGKNKVQFIFSVTGPVRAAAHFLPDENEQVRLQLDINSVKSEQKTSPSANTKKVKPVAMTLPTLAPVATNLFAIKKPRIFTIVIDAGHGGKDPGALGVRGTEEKEVVLSIAKKLAKEINQTPHMRAVLTRSGDYFIPLMQRLKLARKGDADLFVAIHADAHFDKTASGASVYILSQHGASTVAARWLAQRENHSELDNVELNTLKDQSPMLRQVLIDLAQTSTKQDSTRLGNSVLDALEDIGPLHYAHVEHAPFLVLKSPDIPSILIETGFLSNPREESKLKDPAYQDKIAKALRHGIGQYVRKYGVLQ